MEVIKVSEVIKKNVAILGYDAKKLSRKISSYLQNGRQIELSFEGISFVGTDFLTIVIGSLYELFPAASIDENLRLRGLKKLTDYEEKTLNKISKRFKKNKRNFGPKRGIGCLGEMIENSYKRTQ